MTFIKNKRRLALIMIDTAIFLAVYMLSLVIFALTDFATFVTLRPLGYIINALVFYLLIMAARMIIGVYFSMWRYAGSRNHLMLVIADAAGGIAATVVLNIIHVNLIGCFLGAWECAAFVCMTDILTLSSRFVYQHYYRTHKASQNKTDVRQIPVAIIGAGKIGSLLAEELIFDKTSKYKPVCFVDNNKNKIGTNLLGLRVLGNDESAVEDIKRLGAEEILIAISDLGEDKIKHFYEFYSRTGCKVKVYDFPIKSDGDVENAKRIVRDVKIEDLLFRDTLSVVNDETVEFYRGKTVLVTGGGGSIGSEISRLIAKCEPKRLVILDIYENNAYDIQQELIRKYGGSLDLAVEIASVRDRERLEAIFAHYRPEIVFHAAAHKHVPLMEHSNSEAIKNNILGTYNTADMAEKYGTKRFILISTDKAVNPTNVMGASKRMCEMIVQARRDSDTVFAAVRFGNVLGSNGSVIPLFKRQIENGGPVTVTDKRIIRYFMTIPEASGLVMQAGAMAKCGELFVLDMGKPVKIIDLATNMIKLSGLNPYIDIDIVETGLRPGEKLYEELLIKTDRLDRTANNLIFIERDEPLTRTEVDSRIEKLKDALNTCRTELSSSTVTAVMKEVIPTFRAPEEVNINAASSKEMKLCNTN